jgi:hypothetical protein
MAGVKGRSGTFKDKPWTDAIRRAAYAEGKDGQRKLFEIAEVCVQAAIDGDLAAIQEIGNRLDGKPAQESTVTFEKRDASDWSLEELDTIIHDASAGGMGEKTPDPGASKLN